VSGADPLNFTGTLLADPKLPALAGNRLLYRDGMPIAALAGGEIQWIQPLPPAETRVAEAMLARRASGSPLLAYLR
jgi:ATP-dependent Lhr-like helicase